MQIILITKVLLLMIIIRNFSKTFIASTCIQGLIHGGGLGGWMGWPAMQWPSSHSDMRKF